MPIEPDSCETMRDVRHGVDALDRELVRLLARRFAYMRAAARIKPDRSLVRDDIRKVAVIAAASAEADRLGAPVERIARLWENLVESSIAYEFEQFDDLR
ncbi:chorismate mutase [Novosphingobium sp. Gsoil 351]|uniref:chorismate mutase n=1 Tax=Novosphingobium sp. Gsoil 351 TaxID=2675225 RepID=UPI0012B48D84|nr:chorismate mutase [Novosphingobium sp. Gsoil 351]QGN53893.1 chorismate mutase [Novosphingobium sp. Gsoil 351]